MIIDRYLTRELATTFAAVYTVLVVIFLTYSLTRLLTDAASGLLKGGEVLELTLLEVVVALEVLTPIALYFGLIIGLGTLHANSEVIALQACGVSEDRMRRPIITFTGLLIVVVALLSTFARPWAYGRMYALEASAEASSDIGRIKAGEFYLYEEEDRVVFVDRIGRDGAALQGVFVRTREDDELQVISAGVGHMDTFVTGDRHRLTLTGAHIFKQVQDGPNFSGSFGKLTFTIRAATPADTSYKSKAKSTPALFASALPADRAEFQWRLSTPLSTLLLSVLALHLSRSRPREGRYTRLPLALGIYAVYFNLLGVSRTWVEQQTFAWIWWVPGLLIVLLIAWSMPLRRLRRA